MDEHSLWWEIAGLVALLALSAFFSIAETALMAFNRYRLKHLVAQSHGGATRVEELLKRTDRLLGGILIGNTLVIVGASALSTRLAVALFGEGNVVYLVGTFVISFLIIVFSEITPKVIGATYPEKTALLIAYPLKPALRLLDPAAWFVNLFVRPLLWLLRIRPDSNLEAPKLSPEEIRTLVLESSSFMPKKHLSILLNLFDVGAVTVQDIMVPRARIESIKLDDDMETIVRHLITSHHMRLPVFRDALGEVVGVLHLRKVLAALPTGTLDRDALISLIAEPYFVPGTTPVLSQIQFFQENKENIALVVDEYGELMGLVALGAVASDRWPEDPQWPDRRAPAGHSRSRCFDQDRRCPHGDSSHSGPHGEDGAHIQARGTGGKYRGVRSLGGELKPLQKTPPGAMLAAAIMGQ